MLKLLTHAILTAGLISCGLAIDHNKKTAHHGVKIVWSEHLSDDFSFIEQWDYPEGVYQNEFGQLTCDGLCPPETDGMKDKKGMILVDSLTAFYQLVDTTHQFHTIQSDAWCYEWAGTNFATALKLGLDTVVCFTHTNGSTHCSLHLIITKATCVPTIRLNSVVGSTTTKTYFCKGGQLEIDRHSWEKGILKARFDFTFDHEEDEAQPMFWKGKIHTEIGAR